MLCPAMARGRARDDFSPNVQRRLALRASYRCSNPACLANTIGPGGASDDAVVNLGVASHITAAAAGGPRYDEDMTPEERSGISNGIWLCANCSRLVDGDVASYPTALLRQWKSQHEELMKATLAGRAAAIDRMHLETLRTKLPVSEDALANVVPAPAAPNAEVEVRAVAIYRPIHDQIEISVQIQNLGDADLPLAMPTIEVCGVARQLDSVTVSRGEIGEALSPAWFGSDDALVRAGTELRLQLYLRKVRSWLDLDDDAAVAEQVRLTLAGQSNTQLLQTPRSAAEAARNKKLRPLTQWICDDCRLPILRPKDGWIEYTHVMVDGVKRYVGFRIVHHLLASPQSDHSGCYGDDDIYTMHLHHVMEHGVAFAMSILGVPEPDGLGGRGGSPKSLAEWASFARRLWLPFYEQARRHLRDAVRDEILSEDKYYMYIAENLESVVDKYVSDEFTPDPPL